MSTSLLNHARILFSIIVEPLVATLGVLDKTFLKHIIKRLIRRLSYPNGRESITIEDSLSMRLFVLQIFKWMSKKNILSSIFVHFWNSKLVAISVPWLSNHVNIRVKPRHHLAEASRLLIEGWETLRLTSSKLFEQTKKKLSYRRQRILFRNQKRSGQCPEGYFDQFWNFWYSSCIWRSTFESCSKEVFEKKIHFSVQFRWLYLGVFGYNAHLSWIESGSRRLCLSLKKFWDSHMVDTKGIFELT